MTSLEKTVQRGERLDKLEKKVGQGEKVSLLDYLMLDKLLKITPADTEEKELKARARDLSAKIQRREYERMNNMEVVAPSNVGGTDGRLPRASRFLKKNVGKPIGKALSTRYRMHIEALEARQREMAALKREQEKLQKGLDESEAGAMPFRRAAAELVGYTDMMREIAEAVEYYVFKDAAYMKMYETTPPPQIFILKGSSGTGKTMLAHAVMFNATSKGKSRRFPVISRSVGAGELVSRFVGAEEDATIGIFNQAFKSPTVLCIDGAQTIARTSGNEFMINGAPAYNRTGEVITQKIDQMVRENAPTVLILTTDDYNALPEAVKMRVGIDGTKDLDKAITNHQLIEIVQKGLERYSVTNLDPKEVFRTISRKMQSQAHSNLTPADMANAVHNVVRNKKADALRLAKETDTAPLPVQFTLDDFKKNLSRLKEYSEDRNTKVLNHIVTRIKPEITLDDVGGMTEKKDTVFKEMKIALNFDRAAENATKPIGGIILHGPPGTGKTYLAKAIAGEMEATIYTVHGSSIQKPHLGATEKTITDMFDDARKNAPSIIVIDEIETLTLKREMGGNLAAVSTLLAEMGGLKPLNGVVVIGTTNKPELMDDAFRRAGRFDRMIEILPPKNDADRMEIIAVHLKKCRQLIDSSVTAASVLALFNKRIFTPAKIERIVGDAAQLRLMELDAALAVSSVPDGDTAELEKQTRIYRPDLERLYSNLGLAGKAADATGMAEIIPALNTVGAENYRLNISHFRIALDNMKDEAMEEIMKITSDIRGGKPEPAIGKVYGLAALPDTANGGIAGNGIVAVIECVANPKSKEGGSSVIGSEIAPSIRASAEDARAFLNNQSDWAMDNHKFSMNFVSAMKGMDREGVAGPSAGAALALAEYSVATNQPVLPNVVVTGGITIHGELVRIGGVDFRGNGKLMAALSTDGVDTIVMPYGNLEGITPEERESYKRQGLTIIGARNFWEIASIMLATHPNEQQAKDALKNIGTLKVLKRNE